MAVDLQTLKTKITAAEREVDIAERHLKNKQLALQFLQNQLRDLIISDVKGLKITREEVGPVTKPTEAEDESARKERVRRRWRVLGMKIKFGLGAQAMALKQRNLKDASSFIDKETEVNIALHESCSALTILFRKQVRRISWIWRANVPGKPEIKDILEEVESVSAPRRAGTISKYKIFSLSAPVIVTIFPVISS